MFSETIFQKSFNTRVFLIYMFYSVVKNVSKSLILNSINLEDIKTKFKFEQFYNIILENNL